MKRFSSVLLALSSCVLSATAAQAATQVITPSVQPPGTSLIISGNIFSGPISATFGDAGLPTGSFTDLFQFTIPQTGFGSGSVTTSVSLSGIGGATDLDFTSVLVNGLAATGFFSDPTGTPCTTPGVGQCGANEQFAVNNVPIMSGVLNTISISGISRGNGSYGGNATFIPSAVPEPAVWTMMMVGFGGIGLALRRGRKRAYNAAVA